MTDECPLSSFGLGFVSGTLYTSYASPSQTKLVHSGSFLFAFEWKVYEAVGK